MGDRLVLPSDQDATGRSLGVEEIDAVAAAIRSGVLTCTKGTVVRDWQESLQRHFGCAQALACTSGTAAIHIAVAALDLEPGDEIITTSITDMGALTPILYQGAIPVFADVDPLTLNVTPETIGACISSRTRAIIATHLFGNPCDMEGILAVAQRQGIPVIEDAAQAFMARIGDRLAGTFGAIGCFSLQQGKHITTGEGGFVLTNDGALARRMKLFVDKAWGYGDPKPDHYFLALNYRMSELIGAVAASQFRKLPEMFERRQAVVRRLNELLVGTCGVHIPVARPHTVHAYWRYAINVDSGIVPGGVDALAAELRQVGVPAAPRYIVKPAFQCQVFREQRTFGSSRWPFTLARPEAIDYTPERFPGTFAGLASVLVLPMNERFTPQHAEQIADALRSAVNRLAGAPVK